MGLRTVSGAGGQKLARAIRLTGGQNMEFRVLSAEDRAAVTSLFADVFTNEPWNDDWSDTEQLDAYIADLTGQSYSLTLGYYDGDRLAALSMGYIKHWYSGTEYCIDEFCVGRPYQGRGVGSAFCGKSNPTCGRGTSARSSSKRRTTCPRTRSTSAGAFRNWRGTSPSGSG